MAELVLLRCGQQSTSSRPRLTGNNCPKTSPSRSPAVRKLIALALRGDLSKGPDFQPKIATCESRECDF